MIAKKSYYMSTREHKDTVVAEVFVDRELINIMMKAVTLKIATAADILTESSIDDEGMDCINYIIDLASTYKELREALEDIEVKEGSSSIPDDEDE